MNHLLFGPGFSLSAWTKDKGLYNFRSVFILLALLKSLSHATAGEFSCNFDSGLPANAKVYGDTRVAVDGGVDNGGMLELTTTRRNQMGAFIIDPLDGNAAVTGFSARFKALVGGGSGADGFGFTFGKDIPNKAFPEIGIGQGLIVTFDTFYNGVGEITPGVRVLFKNKIIHNDFYPDLQQNRFVDVLIHFEGGILTVMYDGKTAVSNLVVGAASLAGRFAFSARTGGSTDNHFIDDLKITTQVSYPFLKTFGPFGDNVAPDSSIDLVFRDFEKNVNDSSIRLTLDGKDVATPVMMDGSGTRFIHYQPPLLLKPGSPHVVHLAFSDRTHPSVTREISYSFMVSGQIILSHNQ